MKKINHELPETIEVAEMVRKSIEPEVIENSEKGEVKNEIENIEKSVTESEEIVTETVVAGAITEEIIKSEVVTEIIKSGVDETIMNDNSEVLRELDYVKEEIAILKQRPAVKPVPYLKSKESVVDFATMMIKNQKGGNGSFKEQWVDHLKTKGMGGGNFDAVGGIPEDSSNLLLPEPIVTEIVDQMQADDFFNHVQLPTIKVFAFVLNIASGPDSRAKGHKVGDEKSAQKVELKKYRIQPQNVYKIIPIEKFVIDMNTSVDVVKTFTQELVAALLGELKLAICYGDGRDDSDPHKIAEILPIYEDELAIKVEAADGQGMAFGLDDLDRAIMQVRGQDKILVLANRMDAINLKLQKDEIGRRLIDRGLTLEAQLGVSRIYYVEDWLLDPEQLTHVKGAVVFSAPAYKLVGQNDIFMYSEFELYFNR